VLLTSLREGQEATILQLPAEPRTAVEAEAQRRMVCIGCGILKLQSFEQPDFAAQSCDPKSRPEAAAR